MKTSPSQAEIDSYREDAFLIVHRFLAPNEIAELRTAILEAVASMGSSLPRARIWSTAIPIST